MTATTALGYLIAWGPFAGLCIWEMITEPSVSKRIIVKIKFPKIVEAVAAVKFYLVQYI